MAPSRTHQAGGQCVLASRCHRGHPARPSPDRRLTGHRPLHHLAKEGQGSLYSQGIVAVYAYQGPHVQPRARTGRLSHRWQAGRHPSGGALETGAWAPLAASPPLGGDGRRSDVDTKLEQFSLLRVVINHPPWYNARGERPSTWAMSNFQITESIRVPRWLIATAAITGGMVVCFLVLLLSGHTAGASDLAPPMVSVPSAQAEMHPTSTASAPLPPIGESPAETDPTRAAPVVAPNDLLATAP